ncbi:Rrf2 family transcriptional regulator [Streptomyces sp. APSN-46.1]|uniref:RrF2 family transcriptional regulator n=1 Tax=Streptomyces sp. APSN-46.1 TaxID=2929049 RepID=UPI001FB4AD10|nr:Rrf2 family transcriptional regulator [Streptomyces sp. APSN-46.1]MCJ1678088.1 Rrf2 family transcriptional regulator [Streptomyces sp. APSN-46.1]
MRLTRFTDLALRVLMRLAVADSDEELPTTRDVAATMEVPYTHTAKVVARLQHLGLIEARRGRGGGLALTAAGRAASVGGVVRELEGAGDVVDCDGTVPCPLRGACVLRGALRRAQEAFFAALDPLTVNDLVAAPTGPLLLGIAGGGAGGGGGTGRTSAGASARAEGPAR